MYIRYQSEPWKARVFLMCQIQCIIWVFFQNKKQNVIYQQWKCVFTFNDVCFAVKYGQKKNKKEREKILPKNNSVTCGPARETQEKLVVQMSNVQRANCGDLQDQSAAVKFSKGARWWGGAALRRFLEATDGLKWVKLQEEADRWPWNRDWSWGHHHHGQKQRV